MLPRVDQSCNILLKRARAGDAAALGCLLDSYRPYLKFIAASLLRTASHRTVDVSDVVQETNLRAYVKFPTFRQNDEGALVAWLRTIMTRVVLNLLKNQGRPGRRPESLEALLERASAEAHWALMAPGSSPSAAASRREQAVLTANALESLSSDHRQVLLLRYLEKKSHEEIGGLMGRSPGASRQLLMRAAEALQQKLEEQS